MCNETVTHRDRLLAELLMHSERCLECHVYDGLSGDTAVGMLSSSEIVRGDFVYACVIEAGGWPSSQWSEGNPYRWDMVICELTQPEDWENHVFCHDIGAQTLLAATSERGLKALANIRTILEGRCNGYDFLSHNCFQPAEDGVEIPLNWLRLAGTQADDGTTHHEMRRLLELLGDHSLREAFGQVRDRRYDVGCVGVYTLVNYGAHMTYYALYRAIRGLGYSVVMVNPPLDTQGEAQDVPPLFEEPRYPEWAQTGRFANMAEMKRLNRTCHAFVSGSDQMWNNQLWMEFTGFMGLPFVTDDHPKIAYAASAGHDRIWGEEADRATQAHCLARFDAVSVREDSAVGLFRREFGVADAQQVLDPVFLLPVGEYEELADSLHPMRGHDPYMFAYMLEPTREKERILRQSLERLGLRRVYAMTDSDETTETARASAWGIPTLTSESLERWVSLILHSSFVIADSFHGICLAILFHKPFVALVNKERGEARFTSLAATFGFTDRLAYSLDDMDRVLSLPPVDWDAVDGILATERERSLGWLRQALGEAMVTTKRASSSYDMLDARVDGLWLHADMGLDEEERRLWDMRCRLDAMRKDLDAIADRNGTTWA